MLTKPRYGWTDFHLEGTATYALSYLDDLAFEWLTQAIHGLEQLLPFCVKGFLEPDRLVCAVSYWNCHIIVEDDGLEPLKRDTVINECSHTSMLEFCRQLYADIHENADAWAVFADYSTEDPAEKRRRLDALLERLKTLIAEREEHWDEGRCFL